MKDVLPSTACPSTTTVIKFTDSALSVRPVRTWFPVIGTGDPTPRHRCRAVSRFRIFRPGRDLLPGFFHFGPLAFPSSALVARTSKLVYPPSLSAVFLFRVSNIHTAVDAYRIRTSPQASAEPYPGLSGSAFRPSRSSSRRWLLLMLMLMPPLNDQPSKPVQTPKLAQNTA
ncbi:hypothetical protein GALMADRAFT_136267 [Galerina marginata CBS 339.88]|uniref:Uncharacterized protein n=1 Tax=Galerina marginata (strain CBS 339.88) TaxID=685588 RepID=A0A067TDD9_GALM3|nr:hypothetical protein GALMADRAFT_136267 [Galerina marginata CBS 339.88]